MRCASIITNKDEELSARSTITAGLEPVQITVVRCTIAACSLGIVLAIFKPHAFKIHLRHIWVFLGTGVLSIAFYNVCYFACIELCGLSFAQNSLNRPLRPKGNPKRLTPENRTDEPSAFL